jgi:hypothetical protein
MSYRTLVDGYLARFSSLIGVELDPLDENGSTTIVRGSATIAVTILESHRLLLVLSPIMPVPRRNPAVLYRKLLELNFLHTSDGAFAIDETSEMIYLRALRGIDGLDFEEFVDILDAVAAVADEWDDQLMAEFGD